MNVLHLEDALILKKCGSSVVFTDTLIQGKDPSADKPQSPKILHFALVNLNR